MENAGNLKVLMVSTEAAPYVKSGGLGDVAGSLPKELKKHGVDIRLIIPKYKSINYGNVEIKPAAEFEMSLGWRNIKTTVYEFNDGITNYLVEHDAYFGRESLYGYGDDYERFAFFSKAAIEFMYNTGFQADIVHFNDWQAGIGCVYLNDHFKRLPFYSNMKSLFTIHNLQYQGRFPRGILPDIGLNDGYFVNDKLEFNNTVSLMKAGIVYASAVSTVSKTYSMEIQEPYYSYGMDGVLRSRRNDLYGILNGIDTDEYNPQTDKKIYANYSKDNIAPKYENKRALQKDLGLPESDAPLFGIISRMADQKGFDILSIAMDELLSKDIQLVALGSGEARYENMFRHYAWKYPGKLSANIRFDTTLAQRIYAGSDMFLMPSLFEPCGLGQLMAMRYGCVPIVRNTGGLADTVKSYNYDTKEGNGFVFNDYDAYGLMWGVNESIRMYYDHKDHWKNIVKNCMSGDFSWSASAKQYIELYNKLKKS